MLMVLYEERKGKIARVCHQAENWYKDKPMAVWFYNFLPCWRSFVLQSILFLQSCTPSGSDVLVALLASCSLCLAFSHAKSYSALRFLC